MKTIAFFNVKQGVGTTTLVYHLAWMFREMGKRVLAVDLDPQADLTARCLDERTVSPAEADATIYGAIRPVIEGTGGDLSVRAHPIDERLFLISGDIRLATAEEYFEACWRRVFQDDTSAFVSVLAISTVVRDAAKVVDADVVLLDLGPSLGALNRTALIAADQVVLPVAVDRKSQKGLGIVGAQLSSWRVEWTDWRFKAQSQDVLALPEGHMCPIGYVVSRIQPRTLRESREYAFAYMGIPGIYASSVQGGESDSAASVGEDPNCLASLSNYESLLDLSREAGKPMFALRAGDGALGSFAGSVQSSYEDFRLLADRIAQSV